MLRQLISTTGGHVKLLILCATCMGSLSANADWQLVNKDSQLSFVSIKAAHIAERHMFTALSGNVKEDGTAQLSVDLGSVNTGIEIRDQRMRDLLFSVADFPSADFTTALDLAPVSALAIGAQTNLLVQGKLRVQKIVVDVETEISAVKLADNRLVVATTQPLLLSASALGLADGVERLRAIANLPSISLAVPVTFQLLFEKTP
jgi:polyisoprenoid-binding protein YceI